MILSGIDRGSPVSQTKGLIYSHRFVMGCSKRMTIDDLGVGSEKTENFHIRELF